MDKETFQTLMMPVVDVISNMPVDQNLAVALNQKFPSDGEIFGTIEKACHAAIEAGWMCAHGDEGRRYGRVFKPAPETCNLSIDVVQFRDLVGPHHSHPTGEICMTMPVSIDAKFDGEGAGWCVNDPGSEHSPTVSGGEAIVLYLLPEGEIRFTK